jgi:hypothetical protein
LTGVGTVVQVGTRSPCLVDIFPDHAKQPLTSFTLADLVLEFVLICMSKVTLHSTMLEFTLSKFIMMVRIYSL